MSGVSVRTLHHYDEIGLLEPSSRTSAGYRLYSSDDARRLQQVLFYRELAFSLDEVAAILADPGKTGEDHLRRQHRLLRSRIARHEELLGAIEKEMEARSMGMSLTPEEQLEVFGTSSLPEWTAEAEQRWGDSDAWKQSQRRSASYTKQNWIEIKAQADANIAAFAALLTAAEQSTSNAAMDLAEEHRQHISRWFYDCGYDIHRGLAEMYVSDERLTTAYDEIAPGMSYFVRDAILANADRRSDA